MKKDSIAQIIAVTVLVCLGCSVVVSYSAVALRNLQEANKQVERHANILIAAGRLAEGARNAAEVRRLFREVEVRLVDLRTGQFTDVLPAQAYDQRSAQRDPALSRPLNRREDLAGLNRLEHYVPIYFMQSSDGEEIIVLPVRGYGLWSTLYGYLALSRSDYNTIYGLTFAEHAETPGLGGEVDNPKWKAQWPGKKLADADGQIRIQVGGTSDDDTEYLVDGLAGASLTTRGLNNMLHFWFGDMGYQQLIDNLKNNRA